MGGGAGDLSGLADGLVGTGESTGGPTFDVPYVPADLAGEGLQLPAAPAPQISPSFLDRASDFVGKAGAGIGKEFSDSPLKAFSSALGLGSTALGVRSQLKTPATVPRSQSQAEKSQKAAQ